MQGKANSTVFDLSPALPRQHVNLEVDRSRSREYGRWLLTGLVLVGALLFDLGQRNDPINRGFRLEKVTRLRAEEEERGRKLQLEILSLSSPTRIEFLAVNRLHMVTPGPSDLFVVARIVAPAQPPASVVALR